MRDCFLRLPFSTRVSGQSRTKIVESLCPIFHRHGFPNSDHINEAHNSIGVGILEFHGDIAQLGERFVRNEEVVGSNPIISSNRFNLWSPWL